MPVLTNARFYHGEFRLDTDMNQVSLAYESEAVDDTVFNDTTRSMTGGLEIVTVGASGFYQANGDGGQEDVLFDDMGTNDVPLLVTANDAADGDEAYITRIVESAFSHGGAVGEMHTFDYSAAGRHEPLVRGLISTESTETASGNGTAVNVGSLSASETLYGLLSVTSSSGDGSQTLDVTVTGDTSAGGAFGTTHLTFPQVTTAATFGWQSKAGAITDSWFRADFTIGGTGSPSFDFIVAIGKA